MGSLDLKHKTKRSPNLKRTIHNARWHFSKLGCENNVLHIPQSQAPQQRNVQCGRDKMLPEERNADIKDNIDFPITLDKSWDFSLNFKFILLVWEIHIGQAPTFLINEWQVANVHTKLVDGGYFDLCSHLISILTQQLDYVIQFNDDGVMPMRRRGRLVLVPAILTSVLTKDQDEECVERHHPKYMLLQDKQKPWSRRIPNAKLILIRALFHNRYWVKVHILHEGEKMAALQPTKMPHIPK